MPRRDDGLGDWMPEDLDGLRPPWEQQSGEKDEHYQLFRTFLLDEERNASRIDWPEQYPQWKIRKLSARWRWRDRARDYDLHVNRQDIELLGHQRRALSRRERELGRMALQKGEEWLRGLNVRFLTPRDGIRLLQLGVALQRAGTYANLVPLGQAPESEPVEGGPDGDLLDLPPGELAAEIARVVHQAQTEYERTMARGGDAE